MHRLQDLSYSRIVAVDPTTDTLDLIYQGEPREQFFSAHISGVSQLPNGNFLVTEGADGRLLEIGSQRNVVWEWISPFQVTQRGDVCNWVFRAWRYGDNHPGLPVAASTPTTTAISTASTAWSNNACPAKPTTSHHSRALHENDVCLPVNDKYTQKRSPHQTRHDVHTEFPEPATWKCYDPERGDFIRRVAISRS